MYAVQGKYETYKNWQLRMELERLVEIVRKLKTFKSSRVDESLYTEGRIAHFMEEAQLVCDEMNIRGI